MSSNPKIAEAEARLKQLEAHKRALANHRPIVEGRQQTAVIETEAAMAQSVARGQPVAVLERDIGPSELDELDQDQQSLDEQIETLREEIAQLWHDDRTAEMSAIADEMVKLSEQTRLSAITYLESWRKVQALSVRHDALHRADAPFAHQVGVEPPKQPAVKPVRFQERWLSLSGGHIDQVLSSLRQGAK